MEFAKTLMDHVANETRTTFEKVEASFHEWRSVQDDKDATSSYMFDEYMNKVELPRAERKRIYDEYCDQKTQLYNTWRSASQAQKARALIDLLNYELPEEVKHGIDNDRVYTKNVIV